MRLISLSLLCVVAMILVSPINCANIRSMSRSSSQLKSESESESESTTRVGVYDSFLTFGTTVGTPVGLTSPTAIAVSDWEWSVENRVIIGSATGGAGTGKTVFNEFSFTKVLDKVSPPLFALMATGGHLDRVTLALRSVGGAATGGASYYFGVYTFETVFVTKIEAYGDGEVPREKVTMVYGSLTVRYTPQSPTGNAGTAITKGFSVMTNSLVSNPTDASWLVDNLKQNTL